ncbi:MAG: dethiobiotin synthase [Verrucomicrobia bacterium]|nr:MAG: dethiobiotin synthase [Verrucomicrobiota bacterium]
MNFFITGTDTNVGKTYVTRLLLQTLREQGIDAVGYKPVSCGDRDDGMLLAEASGGLLLEQVNPVHLNAPLAPYVAGMLSNQVVDLALLRDGYEQLASTHQQVLVEGAGGWEVPIAENYRVADLAQDLGLPVIIVAANRLGALNHILLTVEAIHRRGLKCAGIYLNQLSDEMDTAMITNKGVLEVLAGVPLLDHLIHQQDFIDASALAP